VSVRVRQAGPATSASVRAISAASARAVYVITLSLSLRLSVDLYSPTRGSKENTMHTHI